MAIKEYKTHKDVPKKYTWKLDFLLDGKNIEELKKEYFNIFRKRIKNKDSKFTSATTFLADLKLSDKQGFVGNKLFNYISNSLSLDSADSRVMAIQEQVEFEHYNLSQEFGSESNRFFKHANKIKKWIQDKKFDDWRHGIEGILDTKKHKLPDKIEEFLIQASRGDIQTSSTFSILTNTELDYGFAQTTEGKKIKLTPANRAKLSKHKDAKVRKTTSIAWRDAYLRHKESLTNMLYQHVKAATVQAKIHKFNTTTDYLIYSDRVDEKLLTNLYDRVKANIDIFANYRKQHAKFYKRKFGKAITKYDFNRDLVNVKAEYTIEESEKLVLESLKPMGKEYTDEVKRAFKENWVDYMPIETKRGGAYSIGGTYGIDKKLILMNFDGQLRSVETLAHEMGHSMHSYFSDKTQPQAKSAYPIFVAEIASIFNELMLHNHLLATSTNDKLKFNIRQQMIDGFIGTVIRQTQWSEYEFELYKAIEQGKPVNTYDSISKLYYEVTKEYALKKGSKYKPEDQFMAVGVPHFYYGFYVYKYAIGQLVANIFFQKYKEEGKEALQLYIDKFLSAGAKDWPLNVLKESGVDLYDKDVYDLGFKAVKENIKEWTKLGNKIFKVNKKTKQKTGGL